MDKRYAKGFERGPTIADLGRGSKRCFPAMVAVILAVGPAMAAAPMTKAMAERVARNRYDHCVDLVRQDPVVALKDGTDWYAADGGAPALHCEALALVAAKRFAEAAAKLDAAAHEKGLGDIAMRADLLDQAGNAWLLAAQADKADASFTAALALAPQDADVLADRARARGQRRDWKGAEADLTAALALDANRADLYVLRASARHAQGRKADANADIAQAFVIYPDYPDALVERGTIKFESGDAAGARADWQLAAAKAGDSEAGQAARQRLQALAAKR